MHQYVQWILLACAAAIASTLAGVTGFGGAAVLMPVLIVVFGMRHAVPILTVAQLIGNGSRAWFNRHELHWRGVGGVALGGGPMALLGGLLFSPTPIPAPPPPLGGCLLGGGL